MSSFCPNAAARLAQRLAAHGDGRAAEQRGGEVFADVRREIRVGVTGDDPPAEDDVRGSRNASR